MKKHHLYIYLGLTILMIVTSIVLYTFDQSPIYYNWPMNIFILSSIVALIVLISAILYLNKKEALSEQVGNVVDWFRFVSMSLMFVLMVFMYFISSATVMQTSMSPTLENEDIVLIYHYSYEPKRNDIIIIDVTTDSYPNHAGEQDYYVKRIFGLPGDTVTFERKQSTDSYYILINGSYVENIYGEKYLARTNFNVPGTSLGSYSEKTMIEQGLDANNQIKDGTYLAFGDNEDVSLDSRDLGVIKQSDIIGKVIFRLSPFGGV